ncbi:MAG: SDR family NAD(P)-dependent oxidoreductase [Acidobacteriota bacterium]
MDLQLTDRVAFVAGSSRGIGRAIASTLLQEGCRVCISGRDDLLVSRAVKELQSKFGDKVFGIPGDMTNAAVIEAGFSSVNRTWGSLDILVANLGSGRGEVGWQQERQEWERLFEVNFFGSVRLAQAAIPYLQSRRGSILFIGSIVGVEATPAPLPYSAAKAALINYSKNLSRAVAQYGIRVNCLAPGNIFFPGGSWERNVNARKEEVERMIATEVPQQRFGTVEEIAQFAAYLVSPQSQFATGGCFIMDGGQTRRI